MASLKTSRESSSSSEEEEELPDGPMMMARSPGRPAGRGRGGTGEEEEEERLRAGVHQVFLVLSQDLLAVQVFWGWDSELLTPCTLPRG